MSCTTAWITLVNHVSFVEPVVLGPTKDDTEIPPTGLRPSFRYAFTIFSIFLKAAYDDWFSTAP